MRSLLVIAAVLHVALGGGSQVAVRLPFLNPAGVTYVSGPAPAGLAAGPALGYAAGGYAPALGFAGAHGPAFGYAAAPALAAPAPALSYAAAPALAPALAPAVAAVPTVHHLPAEAHVPVTRVEAQPGVVSKLVDVAHPAVSTRRFEIRRPAIQKQFYDIEERVVIRPAGSALVELDQPLSKTQRGPAVVNPVAHGLPVAAAPGLPLAAPGLAFAHPGLPVAAAPIAVTPAPIAVTPSPIAVTPAPSYPSYAPAPSAPSFGPAPSPGPVAFDDSDSLAIDNPEFARALPDFARGAPQPGPAPPSNEAQARGLPPPPPPTAAAYPSVEVRGAGAPLPSAAPAPPVAAPAAVVPSLRSLDPNQNQANQQRLIALLTERGGVAEVGFGRAGPAAGPVGDAGPVRARVLSATPAPPLAAPAGERVNTRRVVVSRPIETVQEVDVVEPVTKLHRLAVHQPTVFKTLRQDIARVPTSVPVLGKALAPLAAPVAHALPYAAAPAALPFAGGYLH